MEEFTSEDTAFASKWIVQQEFKSYAAFLEAILKKESNFCSSIANQHNEDFVSPGGCQNTS